MKREGFRELIREITGNKDLDIEQRTERVFQMLDENSDIVKSGEGDKQIAAFSELIDIIKVENLNHEFDLIYLQLITLLAERYVKLKEFRKLKDIALETLDLLREESASFESLEDTIPRIVEALEYSIYNHYLYEILLVFIKTAYKEGKLDGDLKYEVKQVLKLNLLLQDNGISNDFRDKDFVDTLTGLFTSQELMDIILNPSLNSLKVDPVEYTWEWENIYYKVEDELDSILAGVRKGMGYCFRYWSAKEDLLKTIYNINWKSPSRMNPGVMFD